MDRILINTVLYHFLNWWNPAEGEIPFIWGDPLPFVIQPPDLDDGQVCAGGARFVE